MTRKGTTVVSMPSSNTAYKLLSNEGSSQQKIMVMGSNYAGYLMTKNEKENREIMLYHQMSFPFLYLPVQKACVYEQKSTVTHGTES